MNFLIPGTTLQVPSLVIVNLFYIWDLKLRYKEDKTLHESLLTKMADDTYIARQLSNQIGYAKLPVVCGNCGKILGEIEEGLVTYCCRSCRPIVDMDREQQDGWRSLSRLYNGAWSKAGILASYIAERTHFINTGESSRYLKPEGE
ncbi:hypothetical protein 20Aug470_00046 [Pseudomonas phage 20Aug470]|nr:hypothetical protein 20Aug470_00046 [Pseudomonas phage 20Aug470]